MADTIFTNASSSPVMPLDIVDPPTFFPPGIVYILVGCLGVLVWDILDNIMADCVIYFRNHFTITSTAYLGSRLGTLGYILSSVIFQTVQLGTSCAPFEKICNAFYPISLGCTTLLFFFRLRAIYNRDPFIVSVFFFVWCALLACTIILPVGITGGNIATTKYCMDANVPKSASAAIIAPLVFDTIVFIAISCRLVKNAKVEAKFKNNVQVVVFGRYLPIVSRSILLDGQRYYLLILLSNLVSMFLIFATPQAHFRSMCITPNVVVTHIMACRVYRKTKAGFIREDEISTTALSENRRGITSQNTSGTRCTSNYPSYPMEMGLFKGKDKGQMSSTTSIQNDTALPPNAIQLSFTSTTMIHKDPIPGDIERSLSPL